MPVQSDAFQALGDPTRRRIVEALSGGEVPVGDIVERAGVHQSGVSRHLGILYAAGFVSVRPDGQRRLWEARLDRFGAALEEQRKGRRATKKEKKT